MSATNDIFATYLGPARVLRRRIETSPGEAGALMTLMMACFIIFVSQWPYLSLQAQIDPSRGVSERVAYALFAWVFIWPLAFYVIALGTYALFRLLRSVSTAFEHRMALFWALLAAVPLWLLWGMLRGIIGETSAVDTVGFLAFAAFVVFWSTGLREIHRPRHGHAAAEKENE